MSQGTCTDGRKEKRPQLSAPLGTFLPGYYVEVFEGGPWLTKDLTVTLDFESRGVWPTQAEAEAARDRSLEPRAIVQCRKELE